MSNFLWSKIRLNYDVFLQSLFAYWDGFCMLWNRNGCKVVEINGSVVWVGVYSSGIGTEASLASKAILSNRGTKPLRCCFDVVGGVEICSLSAFCYTVEDCNLDYGGVVPPRSSFHCVVQGENGNFTSNFVFLVENLDFVTCIVCYCCYLVCIASLKSCRRCWMSVV